MEPAEIRQAIAQVRRFFEAHGEARFDRSDSLDDLDARPVSNRAGWRKGLGEDPRWFVPPETWKVEVCAGLDLRLVARELAKRGIMEKALDGYQPVWKIQGKSQRGYVIMPRMFDGGEASRLWRLPRADGATLAKIRLARRGANVGDAANGTFAVNR